MADAGHELRTPLTSLRTNIEVLARVGDLPAADRAELLADARQELEELSALVAELVDLAADAPPEEQVAVRLDELVAEAADRFSRRSGREVIVSVEETALIGKPGRSTTGRHQPARQRREVLTSGHAGGRDPARGKARGARPWAGHRPG